MLVDIANMVKSNISAEYVFVRYMGPKFAIAFSGAGVEETIQFVTKIKQNIESIKIVLNSKDNKKIEVKPSTNFVLATYYKGTGIEEVTKKLEEYLDNCDRTESEINCI